MALPILKGTGDIALETKVLIDLGESLKVLGTCEEAEKFCIEGVQLFEELFKNAPIWDQFKVSIIDTFKFGYSSLVEILLAQGKHMEGLVIADKVRSKALLELLKRCYNPQLYPVPELKPLDLDQIVDVTKSLNRTVLFFSLVRRLICTWVIQPDRDDVLVVPQDLASQLVDPSVPRMIPNSFAQKVESLLYEMPMGNRSCEDRSLNFLYPNHPNETTIRFDRHDVCGTNQRDLGQADDSAGITKEAQPSEPFEPLIGSEASCGTNHVDTDVKYPAMTALLKGLFQIVLNPVREFVEGFQVVVVPDGELALVPFAALIDGEGRYVAENLQVRLVPSLATAKMIMERPEEPRAFESRPLVVGDPDAGRVQVGEETKPVPSLPFANKEVRMIGELLGVEPLTADKATKGNFLENAESANLIHIAAHGDMERGEILLAPNSGSTVNKREEVLLRILDLEEKRLRAKLVVLSCCHSGRGDVIAEGIVGIGRAFLGAGARAVLVSLWAVADEATMYFMKLFYEHLISGETASEALSQAMRAMRDRGVWPSPSLGRFVLIGDNVAPFRECHK